MKKTHVMIAGILGFSAVALGAFGAHGLSGMLTDKLMHSYNTGVLYHLTHSIVLLALSLSGKKFNKSFWFIFAGIILFSFSLYAYAVSGILFLAMITPVGGVCLLLGWTFISYEGFKGMNK